ncbi:cupredoxin domain-containing protein [Bradyrhizobium elkanii]|uniref:cupredoxin domain-containing protein n=1 Tax=Bradyrhizobium elkanii TaxID=29448 RepID=UPI003BABE55C
MKNVALALVGSAMLATAALAAEGPAGHRHDESFSAGEPGDSRRPARIVQITVGETDGKMKFVPANVEVRKGEQIKFVLRNNGELDHEFVLAAAADNLKHAETMKKNPNMEHDDPNSKRLAPMKTDEMVWKFTKVGEFEYACLIPGHRESGMIGLVVVR